MVGNDAIELERFWVEVRTFEGFDVIVPFVFRNKKALFVVMNADGG